MPAWGRRIDGPTSTDAAASGRRRRRLTLVAVLAVLLVGAGLRLVMLNAYLPYSHHLDEIRNVTESETMRERGTLEQIGYNYPSLIYDVQLAAQIGASIAGDDQSPTFDIQTTGTAVAERPAYFRLLRVLTGLLPGIVTAALAAAIAWTLSRHSWTTVLAAALAALSPLDLLFGNYVTPDAWSGATSTAAVFAATLVALRPTKARYVLAGALVGVAAGSKYNCILAGLPVVVAHLVANRRPFAEWRQLVVAGFAAIGMFVLVTPTALIAPIELAVGFASVYRNYSIKGQLGGVGNSPGVQLGWLWYGFGLALVAIPSCLLARDRARAALLVPLSFCVAYPLVLAAPKTGYARNLLPVTGVVASTAALGVYWGYRWLSARLPEVRLLRLAAAGTLAGIVLALPVTHAKAAVDASREDPWDETREWLRHNLEPDTVVAIESWAPVVDESRFVLLVPPGDGLSTFPLGFYRFAGVDVVVTTSARYAPIVGAGDQEPAAAEVYRQVLRPECRLFEATGGVDPVGGGRQPEPITIVVASVPDCFELAGEPPPGP